LISKLRVIGDDAVETCLRSLLAKGGLKLTPHLWQPTKFRGRVTAQKQGTKKPG